MICGLSGGVDSSVAAALVHRAVGTGSPASSWITACCGCTSASRWSRPSAGTWGSTSGWWTPASAFWNGWPASPIPEEKRRRIGHTFIDVFEAEAKTVGKDVGFLVQGTLYPDVIESLSPMGGPSVTIKTHHNVGGLPERLPFKLLEPLRELFKDEVRQVGRELGLPEEMVGRHPFPGPGLAIRILGDVTPENLEILRRADHIYTEEIRAAGLYDDIWQAFAVLLPIRSVGVQGDGRTYDQVIALRAVTSRDGMTADWFPFPPEVLARISNRIANEVEGRQPGGVRREQQAARDDRVGVKETASALYEGVSLVGAFGAPSGGGIFPPFIELPFFSPPPPPKPPETDDGIRGLLVERESPPRAPFLSGARSGRKTPPWGTSSQQPLQSPRSRGPPRSPAGNRDDSAPGAPCRPGR